jgi:Skp family chaperone for outer membrane proteins
MNRTNRILTLSIAAASLLGFAFSLQAAGPADKKKAERLFKVGCIDIQEVFDSVPEKANVQARLQTRQKEISARQAQLEGDLSAMVSDLSNQKARLKPAEAAEYNIRIFNKKKELMDFLDASNKELADLEQKLLEPVLARIQTIIKEVTVQYGFSMIIDKSTYVLYVDKELDITDEVIDAIKKAKKEEDLDKAHE